MIEPRSLSPEDFIEEWEGMQKEFVEENFMFRLAIPSLERTKEWVAKKKPI